MDDNTIDLFCPSCNVQVETRVLKQHSLSELAPGGNPAEPVDSLHHVTVFTFAASKRCGQPFLAQQRFSEVPGEFSLPQDDVTQVYPQERRIPLESVPGSAARPYLTALQSYRVRLYEPCVIMCRKCVEAVCSERGASKGSLAQRLRRLQQEGVIDQRLFEWADGLRMVGNDAAHDLDAGITKADARDSLEFAEAILLYVFALQDRFSAFQRRRARGTSDGEPLTRRPLGARGK